MQLITNLHLAPKISPHMLFLECCLIMEAQGTFTIYMCIAKSKRDNRHTENKTACLVKKDRYKEDKNNKLATYRPEHEILQYQ